MERLLMVAIALVILPYIGPPTTDSAVQSPRIEADANLCKEAPPAPPTPADKADARLVGERRGCLELGESDSNGLRSPT